MFVVVTSFNGIPEVFIPGDKLAELDKALEMNYNVRAIKGHEYPWYQLHGSTGTVMDEKYVTEMVNDVVERYKI